MTTRARKRTLLLFIVAIGFALAAVQGAAPVAAQDEQHSDWVPFVGEHPMWCTKSTGIAGSCSAHHNGWAIDINMTFNEPIYAAGPGVVGWTGDGCSPTGGDPSCHNGAGNYVAVDHGDHLSRYIHLASFAPGIEIGEPIAAGQLVGYAGQSGTRTSGPHLHYDEISHPISVTNRIFFGPMLACHGDTAVQYPDVLGTTDWQQIPPGTLLRNDGYECLGGITPEPPAPPAPVEPGPGGAVGIAFGDFNSDAYQDLVVGAPGEAIGTKDDAGTSAVSYGSGDGLGRTQALRQGKNNIKGKAEIGDMFGAAVATGDFDCDGRDDLAIGIPGEDVQGVDDAGAVSVSYGSAKDANNRAVILRQNKWGLPGPLEEGDLVGASLAVGNFDGDDCDDLAIGVPGEDVDAIVNAGATMVIYGSTGGFGSRSRTEGLLFQGGGLAGFTEASDMVGAALASGDFNCDGYDDLAVGVPGEGIDGYSRSGAVSLIYGSVNGLGANPDIPSETIYQSSGIAGILESGDRVGIALASGNFDGDENGCDDLAVGAPSEDLTGGNDAGAVSVVFGSKSGFTTSTVHFQTDGGLGETIEADDNVGAALVAVDINCDGYDDLAVGAPGESLGGKADAGWVGIIRGSATGMAGSLASLSQRSGLPGVNEVGDRLGTSLAAGNIDNDPGGCEELAIGVPGESIGTRPDAGRLIVVQGTKSGPGTATNHYQSSNLPGRSEAGDQLGGPGVAALLGLSLQ